MHIRRGMQMSKDKSKNKHCDYNNFKRARYFHGMLMTHGDFDVEQIYHNEKRKLLNRMLHGWGVVCGLEVKPTKPTSQCVIVEPGLALDCHGNEIVVCEEQMIDLSEKPCQSARRYVQDPCAEYKTIEQKPSTLYVVIRYSESKIAPVSVYAPGGSCEEKTCDYSRIQEGFCIEVWDHWPDSQPRSVLDELGESCKNGFEPCKEPYPCPPTNCCPDQHYILLATISCGPRFDLLISKRITKLDKSASIWYEEKRTLDKVCICKGDQDEDKYMINVTGSYDFDTEEDLKYSSIKWKINWNELPLPDGVKVELVDEKPEDRKWLVEFTIKADANAPKGPADIRVPVESLEYKQRKDDQWEDIEWKTNELPAWHSPIEIGISGIKHSSTISDAMIRNVEERKFVATFPWFAWLIANIEEEEGEELPFSGDLSVHCAAKVAYNLRPARVKRAGVIRQVAKVSEDIRNEMMVKIAEAEKKSAEAIKKVETDYKKKLVKMDKTIKELEEKVKKKA
jgi:hypothetical protein